MTNLLRSALSVVLVSAFAAGCAGAVGSTGGLDTQGGGATSNANATATVDVTKVKEGPPPPPQSAAQLDIEITMAPEEAKPKPTLQAQARERTESTGQLFMFNSASDAGAEAEGAATGPRVDPVSIKQAVAAKNDLFGRCLTSDASVGIDAMIAPSGAVLQVTSPRSIPDEPKLRDCVVQAFKQLTFPALESGEPARIRFDLALKRPLGY